MKERWQSIETVPFKLPPQPPAKRGAMRKMFQFVGWFALLLILLPIGVGSILGTARGWPSSWRSANWSSSGLLPAPRVRPEASVILLSTRTGRWKSIFAEHMSIVLKRQGAAAWTRYDVVGWGNPVRKDAYAADAFWYGNSPRIIYQLDGPAAAALIPQIEASIARYPHQAKGSYVVWPGPNSNTFVGWVVRNTAGLDVELPPVAVGKDWLGPALEFAVAPSKTGYSLSLAGCVGLTLAWEEGLELHLLGSTIGLDPNDLAVKLPALGKLGFYG